MGVQVMSVIKGGGEVFFKIMGLLILNVLALWGLAWVMFRDREDFIDSFVRIFSSEYTYFVPTRAMLYVASGASLLASEYHVLF